MKKLKLNNKLALNKETVSNLDEDQMNAVKGGVKKPGVLSIGSHCTHAHNGCYGSDHTNSAFCGSGCES